MPYHQMAQDAIQTANEWTVLSASGQLLYQFLIYPQNMISVPRLTGMGIIEPLKNCSWMLGAAVLDVLRYRGVRLNGREDRETETFHKLVLGRLKER
jgi:hypothetical protein